MRFMGKDSQCGNIAGEIGTVRGPGSNVPPGPRVQT